MVRWNDLHQADFDFPGNFQLPLENNAIFHSEKIIRMLPKKRLVACGTWENKSVVAKLFYDSKQAREHYEREIQGIAHLTENNIPTPAVYLHGQTHDHRVYFILFERIFFSKNLNEIWNEKENIESIYPILTRVTTELALQHVLGVLQTDLHLNNFFIDDEKIITLDAGQIKIFSSLLPKKESRDHLALFFSQLGPDTKKIQENLFKIYAKSRGWIFNQKELDDLFHHVSLWRKKRWNRFKKKIFRNSSQFARIKNKHYHAMVDRNHLDNFDTLVNKILEKETRHLIFNGRNLSIKQYPMKNVWHFLRHVFFKSHAMRDWILANKENLLDIKKEKPIALIEKKWLGICFESYFVSANPSLRGALFATKQSSL